MEAPHSHLAAASEATTSSTSVSHCDVLAVDDDPIFLALLGRRLGRSGLVLETCSSAEEALDWTGNRQASVLLMDLHLDGVCGLTLLTTLLEEGRMGTTRIRLCTSSVLDAVTASEIEALGFKVLLKQDALVDGAVQEILSAR